MSAALVASGITPAMWYRLSGFYFAYFAFNGVISVYWGLYLQALAFSAWQIAVLMSLQQAVRIVGPTFWGWVSDRTGRRATIVRGVSLAALASFGLLLLDQHFWTLFAALAALFFFWCASLPLVEATTLSMLGKDSHRYSAIRLWGSIGFILSTVGIGHLIDGVGVAVVPWVVLGCIGVIALYAWLIPEVGQAHGQAESAVLSEIVRQPVVLAFFAANFLMALAHGPYYTFFSIYLETAGYAKSHIGYLWALGVVVEVLAFLCIPRILNVLGLRQLFLLGLALAAVRFVVIGWCVGSLGMIVLAQLLHAATFGTNHAASIALVHRFFQGRNQARGQALYISVSFGLGGTLGGLGGGLIWEDGGASLTFSLCGLAAALGWCVAYRWLRLSD
ncbi:PPP family 3-phenylpropionic acid transporter [Chitinivorax tropicus]|uniref:PPP family 3-phenylpropionic acid transporter n=1 Tax=Chitinivorax tropicus TaxID=714531 RepID=A0A840MNZ6_9PROT|nr:MFS transporter [Chitinivorax tropicus]MBB5018809.1 PPP family 3-phenylpropionic acid transporter [Chitinivorax tropicus]